MYVENSFKGRNVNGPIMLAMHPHGIMPHSFLLNGAGRIHAQKPEFYLPPHYQDMSLKSTGVAEPLLFRIPLISAFLYFFGCAEPASKAMMHNILERQVPFGILVGRPSGSLAGVVGGNGRGSSPCVCFGSHVLTGGRLGGDFADGVSTRECLHFGAKRLH